MPEFLGIGHHFPMFRGTLHGACLLLLGCWFLLAPTVAHAQQRGAYYTVRQGDSMAVLAQRFNVSPTDLASANRVSVNATLAPGTRIWVPLDRRQTGRTATAPTLPSRSQTTAPQPRTPTTTGPGFSSGARPVSRPVIQPTAPRPTPTPTPTTTPIAFTHGSDTYTVRSGDSLWTIANRHGLSVAGLASLNGISPSETIKVGQVLRVGGGEDIPGGGVSSIGSNARATGSSRFIWPAEGRVIKSFTNRSDQRYPAIDIQLPKGTEVRASRAGRVVYVGDGIPGYGQTVIISHSGGYATCYGHLDRILVRDNQSVSQGQVIGRSGDSGRGSTPFLKFEIRKDSEAVNPIPLLP